MIPFHITWATADAAGQPIPLSSIGDVYWDYGSLHYTGPEDAGLTRKGINFPSQTAQLQPSGVRITGYDRSSTTEFYGTTSPLVSGDTNGLSDVYYRWNNSYTQLTHGNGASINPQYLSSGANGFAGGVAFESTATNLLATPDTNGASDIFVRTFGTGGSFGAATRVSTTAAGGEANGASYDLIAADWRPFVLFTSDATNLLGDGQGGLFWKDLGNGVLKRADATSDGARISAVTDAAISAYGRYVVFASTAGDAVSGDTNGVSDVFLKDMETGQLTRISTGSDGSQLNFAAGNPSIEANARYVAFEGQGQVWVKDLQTGELAQLTNTSGVNRLIDFYGDQLLFRNEGGGLLPDVPHSALYVATVGETTTPLRSAVSATSDTFTIPNGIDDAIFASNRGGYNITGNALGNSFTGSHYANTFSGMGGDDVFRFDRGPVTATGGAGFDRYLFISSNPYSPSIITDFKIGEDELDFRSMLGARAGSDPTVDGVIRFENDGAGGTRIQYDPDGSAGSGVAVTMAVLRNVPVSSVTWSNVTDRDGPASDDAPVLSSQAGGQGGPYFYASVSESSLRYSGSSVGNGAFYVSASDGLDDVTVDGRAVITDGVFAPTSWTTALGNRIEFVSYDASNGRVLFNYALTGAEHHLYAAGLGDDLLNEDLQVVATDLDGDTDTGTLRASIRDEAPYVQGDLDIVDRADGRSTGNVIRGVRDAEVQYSSGVDSVPLDGATVGRLEIIGGVRDDTPDASGNFVVEGTYGVLTLNKSGDYTYVLRSDAPQSGSERFEYWLKDGDGRPLHDHTYVEFRFSPGAAGADGGQVINSPGPGSTVAGGPGNDTINASQGPDVLTGGQGNDVFAWAQAPWSPARVTDFRVAYSSDGDRLDLSKVLQSVGYTGDDPVRDGYIKVIAVEGGAGILLDRDGAGSGQQYGDYIIKLDGVSASTPWSTLAGQSNASYWISPSNQTTAEGNSGSTAVTFTVNRSNGATAGPGTVDWVVSGFGARPAGADDFTGGAFPTGRVSFAAGETSKTIQVLLAGDTVDEGEEGYQVKITAATGGYISTNTSSAFIGNDDGQAPPPPPADGGQVLTSPGPGSTVTGGNGADTINASQGSDLLTGGGGGDLFRWAKEPWSPATVTDFVVGSDRIDLSALLQAAGYTGADPVADKYVSLTSQGSDTLVLFDRDGSGSAQQWPNYIIKLQGVSGATWTQISGAGGGTTNPPPPAGAQLSFSTAALRMGEGDSGASPWTFYIYRGGSTAGTSTATWTVTGSGTHPADGADFAGGTLPSGTVTFAPGESSKAIVINVAGDTVGERDEEFTVTLSNASAGTTITSATATGTIVNGDPTSPPPPAPGQVYTSPGPGSTVVGSSGDDTLNASQGSDMLTGGEGSDTFAWAKEPWSPATVTDFLVGTDRIDLSALLQAAGYTGSDPVADKYITILHSGSGAKVLFDRDGSGSSQQWPNYIIELKGVATLVTWAELTRSGGGATPPPSGSTTFEFNSTQGSGHEGNSANGQTQFIVVRSSTAGAASVDWTVAGNGSNPAAAADFSGGAFPRGTVTFAAGEGSKVITIPFAADTVAEADEQFYVQLGNPQGGTVGSRGVAIGTILNDDTASPPPGSGSTLGFGGGGGSSNLTEGNGGPRTIGIGVYRNGDTSAPASVEWTVTGTGPNPADAADFGGASLPSGMVNFAAGEAYRNVVITVVGDTSHEPDEAFAVTLSNPQGATLTSASRNEITILNDDTAPSPEGQVINSPGPGSKLNGGSGNDTLNASRGNDTLTGGAGADHFAWSGEPWAPALVTDFAPGTDKIDLRGLFDAVGYAGSDPFGAGYLKVQADGSGGTQVLFDRDAGGNNPQWPNYIIQLQGVAPSAIDASDWIFQ
ncbi:type I secretion C-terminal target domain-containing protein [Phenylobacterium sp.]|uniref:type I secretion C-terminal target domain-containing protein n=1 Tax=Phenylobacterium sp. TaxID=1871053 RepID=UPI002F9561C3